MFAGINMFWARLTDLGKALRLNIDENLTWKEHIHAISKKVASSIGALKRVRPFISSHTAIKIYKGLIEPHFDYCLGWLVTTAL